MGRLTSLWKTRITPRWGTSENLVGHKLRRNVIKRFRTLSWRGNCEKPYNSSVKEKRAEFSTWRIVWGSYGHDQRDRHIGFGGKTCYQNNYLLHYVRNVRGYAYFHPRWHNRGSRRISSAKTFRELWPSKHGLWGTTWMASKIWVGQYKTTYQCWNFCWLASQWESALGGLSCIYVWLADCARQKAWRTSGWSRKNVAAYFRQYRT